MPPRSRERRALGSLGTIMAPPSVAGLLAAAGVFWLAYDGGGYSLGSRGTAAIVVLWLLLLGAAAGLRAGRPPAAAPTTGALLAGLAVWTLLSTGWAASAEGAFAEFARSLLYVAVFALVALTATRASAGGWAAGLAAGITAIGILSVASRLFTSLVDSGDLETLLPTAHARLSWPVNYWNGLAAFVALGFPLLLRLAVSSPSVLTRGVALAPLPVLASAIYLASSRGGALAALAGTGAFVVAVDTRWRAAAAAGVAAVGSVLA